MWKSSSSSSSSSRLVASFLKLHFNRQQINPFGTPSSSSNVFHRLPPNPSSSNAGLSQFQFRSTHHQTLPTSLRNLCIAKPNPFSSSGSRFFSSKTSNFGQKLNSNFNKNAFLNPANAFTSTLSRYREAIGLHFDAFFKRNYLFLFGAGGVFVCALLWRVMFGIANTFVGLSEGMAKYGFLALSAAIVSFAVSCCFSSCPP